MFCIYISKAVGVAINYRTQSGSIIFIVGVGGVLVLFVFTIRLCVGFLPTNKIKVEYNT